jgi:hypothetical protein
VEDWCTCWHLNSCTSSVTAKNKPITRLKSKTVDFSVTKTHISEVRTNPVQLDAETFFGTKPVMLWQSVLQFVTCNFLCPNATLIEASCIILLTPKLCDLQLNFKMEFQQSLPIHSKLTNFLQEATDFVKMGKGGFECLVWAQNCLQEATDCEESGAGVFSMSLKLSSGSYGFFWDGTGGSLGAV